jgi:hypothetical protein
MRKIFSPKIIKILQQYKYIRRYKIVKHNHREALNRIRNKDVVSVAFIMLLVESWKLDSLYWLFDKDDRYDPIIVISPFIENHSISKYELMKAVEFCKYKKYKYFVAYDDLEGESLDIKSKCNLDIIIFTNPNDLSSKYMLIDNFKNYLTCYVPYSFRIDTLYEYEFNNSLVNQTWVNYFESYIHKNLATKYALNKGDNVIVSGFPRLDDFRTTRLEDEIDGVRYKKTIIWAPHWTIKGYQNTGLDWSCFLIYHQVMLNIAQEHKDTVQFIMKPHPLLKKTLSQSQLWGTSRTDDYFRKWLDNCNCQIIDGDYTNAFLFSDALIHDSGSFMTEYFVLNKPIAYTKNLKTLENRFNEFGDLVLSGHYLINDEAELRQFVINVIHDDDALYSKRDRIIRENNLIPEVPSSEIIYNHIKGEVL